LLAALGSTILCTLSGCSRKAPPTKPTPPEVTVARPVQQNIRAYHDFIGNMRAIESVDIRARVEGFLEQIHFKDSDDVNVGDLLFTIEQEPFEAGVAQANAQLESAQADLARTQADLNRVEEAVTQRSLHPSTGGPAASTSMWETLLAPVKKPCSQGS
jgi:multidrug efflux pump subunit AcrA (membrane-fusion protein)